MKPALFSIFVAGIVASPAAFSSAATCPPEGVPYPESYGLSAPCHSQATQCGYDWVTASRQLSPAEVCADITARSVDLTVVPAPLPPPFGGMVCAQPANIADGFANPFAFYFGIADTPYCRDPNTGGTGPINQLGAPYGSPGATTFFCTTPCVRTNTIKLSLADGSSQDATVLKSVAPGDTVALVARVYDDEGRLFTGVRVELTLEAVDGSGGHAHGDNAAVERRGKLLSTAPDAVPSDNGKVLAGGTGAQGFSFRHRAPGASGDVNIVAKCTGGRTCVQEGPKKVWVGIKDLRHLGPHPDYIRIGETDLHPDNMWASSWAMSRLLRLAAAYHKSAPSAPVLRLNDISLERGGIFDLGGKWVRPHAEHCMGTAVDVRANGGPSSIPLDNYDLFYEVAEDLGIQPLWEVPKDANGKLVIETRHFHVRLVPGEGLTCPEKIQ